MNDKNFNRIHNFVQILNILGMIAGAVLMTYTITDAFQKGNCNKVVRNADSLWAVKNLEMERKIYELQRRNQAVENFIDSLAIGHFDYYPCIWDVKQKYTTYVNFHANYAPDSILYPKFKYYGLIK